MKNENPYKDFTELNVWQKARELKNDIYSLTNAFQNEEKYRLADQLIRSSRSISSNIAEGHGRFTYKDQIHFCIQARGSLSEVQNHFIDALDCKIIDDTVYNEFLSKIKTVEKMLNGYISFLRERINEK
jgi:four helix bundle protein